MRKHYLTVNCSQTETEYRLKQLLRVYPPKGIVEDNNFKIYKKAPFYFNASGFREALFCFYGEYRQSGNRTYLAYQIRPGLSIFLIYVTFSLILALTICDVILRGERLFPVLFLLGFSLLFILIIQTQKKKCIADFEKQLNNQIRK